VWELIELIVKAFGHELDRYPVVYDRPTLQDQFGLYGDPALIQQDLGWKPCVMLEAGIMEMAQWAKETFLGFGGR